MGTLIAIVALLILGGIINFIQGFILNIAGLPGALLAGKPKSRSKSQFIFGTLISAMGQGYIYLAYIAFVVNWTRNTTSQDNVVSLIVWPIAFAACLLPLWKNLIVARIEAREIEFSNAQVEALHLVVILAFIAFFAFTFAPFTIKSLWWWVPDGIGLKVEKV